MPWPDELPTMPLDDVGRAKWAEVVAILDARGEPLDVGTLDATAAYCQAWARWAAAEAKVSELGPVIRRPAGPGTPGRRSGGEELAANRSEIGASDYRAT